MRKKTTQSSVRKTKAKVAPYKSVRKEETKIPKGKIRKRNDFPKKSEPDPESEFVPRFPFARTESSQSDSPQFKSSQFKKSQFKSRQSGSDQKNNRSGSKQGGFKQGGPKQSGLKRKGTNFKKKPFGSSASRFSNSSKPRRNRATQDSSAIPTQSPPKSQEQRLQKVLASAGFGSRRTCEELILAGRVEVDKKVIDQLGFQVDPNRSEITVDGEPLKRAKPVYLALFKPKGYLCTNQDEKGRRRAIDLIPESFGRLFPVGRLDMNSEGLLLLTNDGDLAEQLTHPRYGVPKVYRVQVAGTVDQKISAQLKKGVYLAEGFARAERVVIKRHYKQSTILEVTLKEGRNREIRRLLAQLGHKVLTLLRISIGPIKLGKMLPGDFRVLSSQEVKAIKSGGRQETRGRK